ncbi:hypothetical protein BAUCODRAFT_146829 [Baudoinia panamericana UAMH 10762]|uniref:SHSP domain-containing protein n=1 Tax=Baudoinia panamericana (strain UAMH 10762) TaxID=717646 RepID=M2NG48_BAUPA|nr:uncharacterized protein BAUCODRAFT_146829 [Baudoinia panamericana UAMH 10762]EMC98274.1 hypothetical protein BAUCODRAFT_146829 [Baudoinia panamericana UAMH 10762]
MSAGIWDVFSGEPKLEIIYPIVDRPSGRAHPHHAARSNNPTRDTPNYPDVDVRDGGREYWVDVEVPGIKNVEDIHCQWTSNTIVVVSGNIMRPIHNSEQQQQQPSTGGRDAHGVYEPPPSTQEHYQPPYQHVGPPYTIVSERRIGHFRRIFHLPVPAEVSKMTAKLEAGLLSLTIPKAPHTHVADGGKVFITTE